MRTVKTQFYRICFVLGVLLSMTAWQFDFVRTSVSANPALNMTIFGTFLFGVTLVFSLTNLLRNEYRALYALIELYDDVANEDSAKAADPLWKYFRTNQAAIIFKKPQILAQSYQLISGQLYRNKELQISAGTMQTLIDGIDERLQEQRSLISYVAGILIFLGLIGTFLGLMITLASVGDILGGLDLTGSDPTATVSGLMENLQTPLAGMATGFSSSLFGLITSLTLSLTIQLVGRAGGNLKSEFSSWLANIVRLNENANEGSEATIDGLPLTEWVQKKSGEASKIGAEQALAGMSPAAFEERRLALLMRAARHAIVSTNRHSREFNKLTTNVNALAMEARTSRDYLNEVADSLQIICEQNKVIHLTLARTIDAFEHTAKNADVRAEIAELTGMMSAQLEVRDARLVKVLRQTYQKVAALSAPAPAEKSSPVEAEGDELAKEFKRQTTDLNVRQLQKLLMLANRIDETTTKMAGETPAPRKTAEGQG